MKVAKNATAVQDQTTPTKFDGSLPIEVFVLCSADFSGTIELQMKPSTDDVDCDTAAAIEYTESSWVTASNEIYNASTSRQILPSRSEYLWRLKVTGLAAGSAVLRLAQWG